MERSPFENKSEASSHWTLLTDQTQSSGPWERPRPRGRTYGAEQERENKWHRSVISMACSLPACGRYISDLSSWEERARKLQSRTRALRSAAAARRSRVATWVQTVSLLRATPALSVVDVSRSVVLWRPNNTFSIIAAGRTSERLRGRTHVWPEL